MTNDLAPILLNSILISAFMISVATAQHSWHSLEFARGT